MMTCKRADLGGIPNFCLIIHNSSVLINTSAYQFQDLEFKLNVTLIPSSSPYNRKVRTELLQHYGRNRKFYLKRKRFDNYQSEMARSLFCLCPLGWAPWSPRLVESVLLGCIPVIIADNIRLPFPSVLRWPEISLQVAEKDIASLETVLDHVVATNLTRIQKNLWDPMKRKALVFNRPMEVGDATWQVLRELEILLDQSQRRYVGSWR